MTEQKTRLKRKLAAALLAAAMLICCACSNTLESFAGSFYTSADGWTADEKGTTYIRGTDVIHFAGNYVTWTNSGDTYDKKDVAGEFVRLSDAAGITNGTLDYSHVEDGASTEHYTLSYEEASELAQ